MSELDIVVSADLAYEFPKDYKIHNVGDNIAIVESPVDLSNSKEVAELPFFRITGKEKIPRKSTAVAVASLPTAGNAFDLGSASDWLQSYKNILYKFLVGFDASQYVEWEIKHPKAGSRGGIRSEATGYYTSDDSPYRAPRIPINVHGDDMVPNFKMTNYSQYTLTFAKLSAIGYGYEIVPLDSKPKIFEIVPLGGIEIR